MDGTIRIAHVTTDSGFKFAVAEVTLDTIQSREKAAQALSIIQGLFPGESVALMAIDAAGRRSYLAPNLNLKGMLELGSYEPLPWEELTINP